MLATMETQLLKVFPGHASYVFNRQCPGENQDKYAYNAEEYLMLTSDDPVFAKCEP